ncbi:MAG: type VII secretion-associated serine protease mycosin [Hamadaea sp.]|uniref:type VII secretion-associated serine protease mycosin n=1 Tax=Hamadaea sp. NPDC050747 TaxID=3155789 RepID=UPI0018163679|nr:type VII secretion-associated serine protease mycosin [Hamadaea sp.]
MTPVPGAIAADGRGAGYAADKVRGEQWQLSQLHAQQAWRWSTGSGVTVAVIDSGVDGRHPDLAGQVLPGTDFVRPGGDGQTDAVGHGTTVAGLIAGRSDDSSGVLGLAPGAKILPVRVLDAKNEYDDARIVANAVRWSVDHGAAVINLSLGGSVSSPELADALDYAFEKDVVVVACTGNEAPPNPDDVWYPAREPGVLAVTGLGHGDGRTLWAGALTGPATVLAAPGADLVGARPGGYWTVEGTSFAAPLVSATAALIRSKWPEMSAANVVNRLIATADDLGPLGRDATYGFGAVDPVAALTLTVPGVPANPLDTVPPPGKARFGKAGTTATASPAASVARAEPERAAGHRPLLSVLPAGIAVVLVLVGGAAATLRRFT